MSNPFSYEIDERNLRIQLRNLEVTQREEAWQKFESFANQHPIESAAQGFSGLHIKINKSAIVPVIFGLVIIVFAIILYNFVSIDKDKEEDSQLKSAAPATEEVIEAAAPVIEPPKPETKVVTVVPEPEKVAAVTPPAVEKQKVEAPQKTETKKDRKQASEPAVDNTTATAIKTEGDSSQPAEVPVQKKKRNRKAEEATISALKPTVVSEEETPVEIPQ